MSEQKISMEYGNKRVLKWPPGFTKIQSITSLVQARVVVLGNLRTLAYMDGN